MHFYNVASNAKIEMPNTSLKDFSTFLAMIYERFEAQSDSFAQWFVDI
jgi:hypothetical protein